MCFFPYFIRVQMDEKDQLADYSSDESDYENDEDVSDVEDYLISRRIYSWLRQRFQSWLGYKSLRVAKRNAMDEHWTVSFRSIQWTNNFRTERKGCGYGNKKEFFELFIVDQMVNTMMIYTN